MSETPKTIGRYDVIRLVGEGGMGRVFLAKDPVLGREVAIKVLRDDLALPPDVKEQLVSRMRNEARAAATVRHPNLVTLHDMGESDEVGLFLVFEYVQGPTLRERIATEPVPPLEVARIAMELGAALTTAHEAGVIHRDVKPENVICSATGAVLTDFGLARIPDSNLTTQGMKLGTIGYAAPETLTASGTFSAASDQFSLAATLYEALSGKRAFDGDDILAIASRIANDEPPLLTDARGGGSDFDYRERLMLTRAEGVLRRALQKEPTLRYPSCRAFGDALGSAIDVRVSSGFPTISMHSASIVPRATRRWQNIAIAAALALIAGLFFYGRSPQNHDGASLKSAASAFSAAVPTPSHHHPRHHPHPAEITDAEAD
ncbi:MAG TPA: serine/threonine-protein kinase [Polyangiaceae bacterium]|jgi:serine/threonine-protein kinase